MSSLSMEGTQSATILVHKNTSPQGSQASHTPNRRSLGSCIFHSWRSFAAGWRNYLSSAWPQLLLVGTSCAFLCTMMLQYATNHALPALRMMETKMDDELVRWMLLPSLPTFIYLLLAAALCIFCLLTWEARIFTMGQSVSGTKELHREPLSPDHAERHLMRRLFAANTLWAAIGLLGLVVIACSAWFWCKWLFLLLPLWMGYVWTTANCTRTVYVGCHRSLKTALRTALRRSMGLALLLQMVSLLPLALISCIFLLPLIISWLAELATADTLLRGDTPDIPSFIPLLYFLLSSLSFSFLALIGSLRTWSLTLYFDVESRRTQRM